MGRRRPPAAENVMDLVEAPLVVLGPEGMWIDGMRARDPRTLADVLRNKRQLWLQLNPGRRFHANVMLEADIATTAGEIREVMHAAHRAGFGVSFVVRRL